MNRIKKTGLMLRALGRMTDSKEVTDPEDADLADTPPEEAMTGGVAPGEIASKQEVERSEQEPDSNAHSGEPPPGSPAKKRGLWGRAISDRKLLGLKQPSERYSGVLDDESEASAKPGRGEDDGRRDKSPERVDVGIEEMPVPKSPGRGFEEKAAGRSSEASRGRRTTAPSRRFMRGTRKPTKGEYKPEATDEDLEAVVTHVAGEEGNYSQLVLEEKLPGLRPEANRTLPKPTSAEEPESAPPKEFSSSSVDANDDASTEDLAKSGSTQSTEKSSRLESDRRGGAKGSRPREPRGNSRKPSSRAHHKERPDKVEKPRKPESELVEKEGDAPRRRVERRGSASTKRVDRKIADGAHNGTLHSVDPDSIPPKTPETKRKNSLDEADVAGVLNLVPKEEAAPKPKEAQKKARPLEKDKCSPTIEKRKLLHHLGKPGQKKPERGVRRTNSNRSLQILTQKKPEQASSGDISPTHSLQSVGNRRKKTSDSLSSLLAPLSASEHNPELVSPRASDAVSLSQSEHGATRAALFGNILPSSGLDLGPLGNGAGPAATDSATLMALTTLSWSSTRDKPEAEPAMGLFASSMLPKKERKGHREQEPSKAEAPTPTEKDGPTKSKPSRDGKDSNRRSDPSSRPRREGKESSGAGNAAPSSKTPESRGAKSKKDRGHSVKNIKGGDKSGEGRGRARPESRVRGHSVTRGHSVRALDRKKKDDPDVRRKRRQSITNAGPAPETLEGGSTRRESASVLPSDKSGGDRPRESVPASKPIERRNATTKPLVMPDSMVLQSGKSGDVSDGVDVLTNKSVAVKEASEMRPPEPSSSEEAQHAQENTSALPAISSSLPPINVQAVEPVKEPEVSLTQTTMNKLPAVSSLAKPGASLSQTKSPRTPKKSPMAGKSSSELAEALPVPPLSPTRRSPTSSPRKLSTGSPKKTSMEPEEPEALLTQATMSKPPAASSFINPGVSLSQTPRTPSKSPKLLLPVGKHSIKPAEALPMPPLSPSRRSPASPVRKLSAGSPKKVNTMGPRRKLSNGSPSTISSPQISKALVMALAPASNPAEKDSKVEVTIGGPAISQPFGTGANPADANVMNKNAAGSVEAKMEGPEGAGKDTIDSTARIKNSAFESKNPVYEDWSDAAEDEGVLESVGSKTGGVERRSQRSELSEAGNSTQESIGPSFDDWSDALDDTSELLGSQTTSQPTQGSVIDKVEDWSDAAADDPCIIKPSRLKGEVVKEGEQVVSIEGQPYQSLPESISIEATKIQVEGLVVDTPKAGQATPVQDQTGSESNASTTAVAPETASIPATVEAPATVDIPVQDETDFESNASASVAAPDMVNMVATVEAPATVDIPVQETTGSEPNANAAIAAPEKVYMVATGEAPTTADIPVQDTTGSESNTSALVTAPEPVDMVATGEAPATVDIPVQGKSGSESNANASVAAPETANMVVTVEAPATVDIPVQDKSDSDSNANAAVAALETADMMAIVEAPATTGIRVEDKTDSESNADATVTALKSVDISAAMKGLAIVKKKTVSESNANATVTTPVTADMAASVEAPATIAITAEGGGRAVALTSAMPDFTMDFTLDDPESQLQQLGIDQIVHAETFSFEDHAKNIESVSLEVENMVPFMSVFEMVAEKSSSNILEGFDTENLPAPVVIFDGRLPDIAGTEIAKASQVHAIVKPDLTEAEIATTFANLSNQLANSKTRLAEARLEVGNLEKEIDLLRLRLHAVQKNSP